MIDGLEAISRHRAIATVLSLLTDEIVVAANGMISREVFASRDRADNFYMIGSMGLAAAIGLGVALSRPERKIVVFDGDGNLLMGLGILPLIAERRPTNFHHVVFDNEVYASTGGQRSISDRVALDSIAAAAGYRHVSRSDGRDLVERATELLETTGPSLLLVKVRPGNPPEVSRVSHSPARIARRCRRSICSSPGERPEEPRA